jgi:acyl carrier protein
MVPAVFMMLDALPLLPSGKVDRRALPAPGRARPALESRYVAPRTPVEAALAEIWAEVLHLEHVGIYDHFLELGGDSLSATRVLTQVLQTFQVEVPLRALFESPTVAAMAVVIAQNQAQQAEPADIERLLAELEMVSDERVQRATDSR